MRENIARPSSWMLGLLLACLCFLLYSPSFSFQFINYDDERVLLHHPELYNPSQWTDGLKAIFVRYYPREEPLLVRDVSWLLDSMIFGFTNPTGYHFMNVLYHSIVVALLFAFLHLTTRRRVFAFAVSFLFILLAVHVETVDWIMGRKDILATVFLLLSLIAQAKMLNAQGSSRWTWYLLSLGSFLFALLSKISVVVFPAVLFLQAFFWRHLQGEVSASSPLPWKKAFTRILPLYIPHCVLAACVYGWYHGVLSAYGLIARNDAVSLAQRIGYLGTVAPLVILKYIQLILFPKNLSLFYLWPDISSSSHGIEVAAGLFGISLLALLGIFLGFRRKDLLFYFLCFFAMMIPYLNIFFFSGILLANRYIYFSSFCILALIVGWILHRPEEQGARIKPLLLISLGLTAVVNLIVHMDYQKAWQTNEALWTYEIALPQTRAFAFENLATLYYQQAITSSTLAERSQWLAGVEDVVQKSENRFWDRKKSPAPPSELHLLYLMRALVSQVRQDPDQKQLGYLQQAEKLNPCFYATLFQLYVFHYRQALQCQGEMRKQQALVALEYFSKYAYHVFKDGSSMARIEAMKKMFKSDFPFLNEAVINTVHC